MGHRHFYDRFFRMIVRSVFIIPLAFLTIIILSVFNQSMGKAIRVNEKELRQWSLLQTVLHPESIQTEIEEQHLEGNVFFRIGFFSSGNEIGVALGRSILIVIAGICVAFPLALGTTLWLEHAKYQNTRIIRFLLFIMHLFVQMPYIIHGVFALGILSVVQFRYSGTAIQSTISGTCVMGIIALPRLMAIMTRELSAIPHNIRQSAFALGASKITVLYRQVLPFSIGFIATETLRFSGRLLGLASPFIVLDAYLGTMFNMPLGNDFAILPVKIFQWASYPDNIHRSLAASAALFLMFVVLCIEMTASMGQRRLKRKREGLR